MGPLLHDGELTGHSRRPGPPRGSGSSRSWAPQLPALEALDRQPEVITVGIGGNDLRAYDRATFAAEVERLTAALGRCVVGGHLDGDRELVDQPREHPLAVTSGAAFESRPQRYG